jgi:hypothetical protein
LQRTLAKVNYHIHTYAIKVHLIPNAISKEQAAFIYADEADLLNVALFGKTAKLWSDENGKTNGNMRDMATLEQLVVLSNMESINAVFINKGMSQSERLLELNKMAIAQMQSLLNSTALRKLK